MSKDAKQQRLLSLLLVLSVLLLSWLFFLQPSLSEKSSLQSDLNNRQSIVKENSSWLDQGRVKAESLNLSLVRESENSWIVTGSFASVLDLAAFIQTESGQTIRLNKKDKRFTISW